jgi:Phosphodiester glycosidase
MHRVTAPQRADGLGSPLPGGSRRSRASRPRHLLRRAIVIVLALFLISVGWSYANALTAPGSAPLSARTVEWLKGHGGRGVVLWAERTWYSIHQPPVGGTPQGGLPYARSSPSASSDSGTHRRHASPAARKPPTPEHLPAPPDIRPIAAHPLADEGAWQPAGPSVGGIPAVRVAYVRPDRVHTSLVTGVAWMDDTILRGELVAGTQSPGGSGWRWGADVPRRVRPDLAATFNSGFLLADSRGGYYSEGRTAAPLRQGAASVVIYTDGTMTVGRWGKDVSMGPDVASVRQNLSLIVNHGDPVSGLATDSLATWGATLGNSVLVWRSGLGVTRDGALIYAAGPGLSVESLARVLARAGCVRAMELDINTDWVSFNSYRPRPGAPFGVAPKKLLPIMERSADRYLVPDERDFFAMTLRPKFTR